MRRRRSFGTEMRGRFALVFARVASVDSLGVFGAGGRGGTMAQGAGLPLAVWERGAVQREQGCPRPYGARGRQLAGSPLTTGGAASEPEATASRRASASDWTSRFWGPGSCRPSRRSV